MSATKPFHRTYREMKPGPQAGYSSWAYICDRDYARSAEHYIRAFLLIQNELQSIFEYLEPSDECRSAYSYRIHALFMRTCIEIEANLKSILDENRYTPKPSKLGPIYNMGVYKKIEKTHHLSSYEVILPIWSGKPAIFRPFSAWSSNHLLPWYQDYNASKHDRQEEFKKANFENLVTAVAGLLVVISSQFRDQDFSAGSSSLIISGYDYHPMEAAIGSLFRIKYPDDWSDDEMYEFDWTVLKSQSDRFEKIDFNKIP